MEADVDVDVDVEEAVVAEYEVVEDEEEDEEEEEEEEERQMPSKRLLLVDLARVICLAGLLFESTDMLELRLAPQMEKFVDDKLALETLIELLREPLDDKLLAVVVARVA